MSAKALFDSFRNYLDVQLSVPSNSYPGNELQVGEDFNLRVRVRNIAPSGIDNPRITFRNVRVSVSETQFADLRDGNGTITQNVDDPVLTRGGDAGETTIRMRATQAILGPLDTAPFFYPENFAIVTVQADVDQDHFFRISERHTAVVDIKTT